MCTSNVLYYAQASPDNFSQNKVLWSLGKLGPRHLNL